MMISIRHAAIAAATLAIAAHLGTAALPAHAADTTPSAPAAAGKADPLAAARALIAENKWRAAIDELQRTPQPENADWNNLMGYSHRKARTPDLPAAERYYDAALRIDPKHRGALEYSGELYLMMGDLQRAEQRLAALDKACLLPCAEYTDLKAAIAAFKANGNRHAARP
jgi:tetratricopeptide (TPR) repeat protein